MPQVNSIVNTLQVLTHAPLQGHLAAVQSWQPQIQQHAPSTWPGGHCCPTVASGLAAVRRLEDVCVPRHTGTAAVRYESRFV